MTRKKILTLLLVGLVGFPATLAVVVACFSSLLPPQCPRTTFLGKTSARTIVLPPGGGAFTALIGLLPFVGWDASNRACAMPASAGVTLTLTCTPVGGGAAFTLGPQTFGLATPTTPGAQPVAGGGVNFAIPAGTPASTCLVTGTYGVNFANGVGAGTLSATGDLEVCLVDPSPLDPSLPVLDLQILDVGSLEGPAQFTAIQGDQPSIFALVANNSDAPVVVSFESEGRQIAGLPDGFDSDAAAYGEGIFRISQTSGDVFPSALFTDDGPLPTERVAGAPTDPFPPPLEMNYTLGPREIDIIGININSFGACADGSCNERNLCVQGAFQNGPDLPDLAKACTQFTYRVDNSLRPRYPGRTFDVATKSGPPVDAQWSNTQFFDANGDLIDETHEGNLPPPLRIDQSTPLQTTGDLLRAGLPPQFQFPGRVDSRITLPANAAGAGYEFYLFDQRDGFVGQHNVWQVDGLEEQVDDCDLPAFSYMPGTPPDGGGFRNSFLHLTSDGRCGANSNIVVQVEDDGQLVEIFNGTFGAFEQEVLEDRTLKLDPLTCRTFTFPHGNQLNADLLVPDPPFVKELLGASGTGATTLLRTINLLDRNGDPAPYQSARIEGGRGLSLGSPNGTGELDIFFDPTVFDEVLETIIATLQVESPTAINATREFPLEIPIVVRAQPLLPMLMPEVDGPGLIQVGNRYKLDVTLDPDIADLIQDLECLLGFDTPDDVQLLSLPDDPFSFDPFDEGTSQDEQDRVSDLFGQAFDTGPCIRNERRCFLLKAEPGIADMEIFADGFESGDTSAWATSCRGSNTEAASQKSRVLLVEKRFGVLDENNTLPVFTEEELRTAIELFNEDVDFDEKTIGLVSDRFGIDVPLPPIRGTYFFDEFKSFRKSGRSNHPVLDGSRCPPPCSGLVFEADGGGVSNLRLENFPSHGVVITCDSLWIASNEFAANAGGGLLISGNNNFVADSLARANVFEDNGGPAITVLRGTGNRLTYNIFAAGAPLIDLGGDGRTENDDGDRDTGPNDLQNFPVLTNVMTGSTVVQGTLNSTPSSRFILHFYAEDADSLRFLGEAEVRTDASGNTAFDLSLDGTAAVGERVYATATNVDGSTSEFSRPFAVVGVAAEDGPVLPTRFALFQNYPNPFNPSTTIQYDVPRAGAVRLEVIDLAGRQVALLVDKAMPAGRHTVSFGARHLPSGVYLYRLSGEGFETTKKLLLLK